MSDRRHVVLLGDSIFDNGAYTRGEPDVLGHLQRLVSPGWCATSCAVDGATTSGLDAQLHRLPADATDLVVSIGGNDVLQNVDLLSSTVSSTAAALDLLADRLATFERAYRRAIARVLERRLRTTVCTIYNGAIDPARATAARIGLTIFNDAILRTALDSRLDVIELRSICMEPADYANPIEPSGPGGLKIARAIACAIGGLSGGESTRLWTRC